MLTLGYEQLAFADLRAGGASNGWQSGDPYACHPRPMSRSSCLRCAPSHSPARASRALRDEGHAGTAAIFPCVCHMDDPSLMSTPERAGLLSCGWILKVSSSVAGVPAA